MLIGAPGAGKGTQARMLEEKIHIPQISTGDMFRALAKSDSPLANEVRELQAAGKFVSDDLTVKIVEDRTSKDDCKEGYLLDGFPRTLAQAEALEGLAEVQNKKIQAILVDVPLDDLEKRMTGRRSCPICGEIYNVFYKQPKNEGFCDFHPEQSLQHRADDTDEKVKVRLATYDELTKPLLDYYEKSERLEKVNGIGDPDDIYNEIEKLVLAK